MKACTPDAADSVNDLVLLQLMKAQGCTSEMVLSNFNALKCMLCHCFYSLKGSLPDASESSDSLQLEGT